MGAELRVFDVCRHGTHALGPGCRYVVWVQGCRRRCPGCLTPESRPLDGGTTLAAADLAADIVLSPHIDGITISGGEPFLQAPALAEMLVAVRSRRPGLTVIVYTGFRHEELMARPDARALLELTDVLIDGEYVEALNDGRGIRGSSNQRVICLSPRLRPFADAMVSAPRRQEIVAADSETAIKIGIPNTLPNYE